jgi:hypothetical protein
VLRLIDSLIAKEDIGKSNTWFIHRFRLGLPEDKKRGIYQLLWPIKIWYK